jgi:glyoxylase-like metal-dependent hydrolase (beta-lactamase superfamily II)
VETTYYRVGDVSLVRVPYADVVVDAAVVGLTEDQVSAIGWASPAWADQAQVRIGAAVWVIESDGCRIVVDPAQAADGILRTGPGAVIHQQAVATALATAGFPRDTIGTVIASHIDGIGMIAWFTDEDSWTPFFPNAEVLVSRREYEAITAAGPYRPQGSDALIALDLQGVVTTIDDEHAVTSDVVTRWTGCHSPGHQIVNVVSRGVEATMLGHLALSPLHCAIGEFAGHIDPPSAESALRALRDRRNLLIGPLWPTPGAARWTGHEMQAETPTAP